MPEIPAGFLPPFHIEPRRSDEPGLYLYDSKGQMAADLDEHDRPRARGWGRVQCLDDGAGQMDAWEAWFAERVGDAPSLEVAMVRLNDGGT